MGKNENRIIRDSNIEMLKVVALCFIVISHIIPRYGDHSLPSYVNINLASTDINHFFISFISNLGSVGNCIFVVCSSWFLIGDMKIKIEKIWNLAINTWVISILYLLAFLAFGVSLSGNEVLTQVFPISFNTNWFISCYILFYLLHPAVNLILDNLNQKQHFAVTFGGGIFYSILQIPFTGAYFCNEIISFYLIYFIVFYIKRYLPISTLRRSVCIAITIVSAILYFSGAVFINFLGTNIGYFSNKMYIWRQMNNPLIIVFSISLFLVCYKINIQSSLINKISSVSLIVYLVHENPLVNKYLKAFFWNKVYDTFGFAYVLVYVFIFAAILFCSSITVSYVYQILFGKIIGKVASRIIILVNNGMVKVMELIKI